MIGGTFIILHFSVIVNTFIEKRKEDIVKGKFTEFGKKIKFALIERELTQEWLISEVKKKTGLYFDSSYLNKIMTGQNNAPKIVAAIKEILEIKEG